MDLWSLDHPELARIAEHSVTRLSVVDRFHRERSRHTSVDGLLGAIAVLSAREDTTADLASTGLPVCVAHGVDDTDAWPQSWQRTMAEQLHARYERLEGCAAAPHQENPLATADLLNDFWSNRRA
jgi:pimeloyl-ACP methyl ester carboxylesterase